MPVRSRLAIQGLKLDSAEADEPLYDSTALATAFSTFWNVDVSILQRISDIQ